MRKVPTSKFPFYVYDIIDPRTNRVFYVGCGKGNRIRTTLNPSAGGHWKRSKLESIAWDGLEPIATIVMCFATRPEALIFERERQIRFFLAPDDVNQEYSARPTARARPNDHNPVSSWCGHPKYDRVCRFLPQYCVPRMGS